MSHLNSKSPNTNSIDDFSNSDADSPPVKINAFQFMMNSRHKVIGSNSPGKERKEPRIKSPKVIEKEKEKLNKRKAIFEDWVEKKGGTKRKLADEAKEKYIQKTMHKRAKRLKNMLNIIDNELNKSLQSDDDSNSEITKPKKRIAKICDSDNSNDAVLNTNNSEEIFQDDIKICEKKEEQKQIKVTNKDNKESHSHKKKKHKRSLSLKKSMKNKNTISNENSYTENMNDDCDDIFPKTLLDSVTPISASRKTLQTKINNESNSEINKNECFSPRSWRMKVKLLETTNDEEDSNGVENIVVINDSPKKSENKVNEPKKNVKLAPLFLRHSSKEAINAKKNFLYSSVPTKVKKLMTHSKSFRKTEHSYNLFPKISHVQQKSCDEYFWDLPNIPFTFIENNSTLKTELCTNLIKIGTFSDCKSMNNSLNLNQIYEPPQKYNNLQEIIKEMKKKYSEYPIYKTFRLLYKQYQRYSNKIVSKIVEKPKPSPKRKKGRSKKKKEINNSFQEFDQINETSFGEMLMWTEKYKPQNHEEIIGNFSAVKELKSWLESWIAYSEDQKSSKRRNRLDSNTSDDFCSDSTTNNTDILPQNLVILIGPFGSGKTSSVYALCNELNLNIIEINASSKRPGKKILTELQEATQSHQVKNTDSKSVGSFFQKNSKSDDDINKKLSLLLVEDVDIVFEDQDDGFISALMTLATTSKRPIILTSTDKRSPYLQKFISQHSVIYFNPLSDKILSPWLQILCLIEGVRTDGNKINNLVRWCKGDLRKIILQLQFWIQTGGDLKILANLPKILDSSYKLEDEDFEMKDDCSNFSWMNENSETDNRKFNSLHQDNSDCFIPPEPERENWKLSFPVNLGVLWWNIPSVLGLKIDQNTKIDTEKSNSIDIQSKEENNKKSMELKHAIDLLENLVFADVMYTKHKIESDHEPIYNYWQTNPENSLLRNENFHMYNNNEDTSLELVHWLLENNVKNCTKLFENINALDLNKTVPFFEERRWRSKRHKSMKDVLNIVPTFCILDRKAICEDYQTILRTICRIENQRFTNNSKRKNRFYHYFKTLNIYLNDSTYLALCESLEKNS